MTDEDHKILHWNYHEFEKFPESQLKQFQNCRIEVYLKGNRIQHLPSDPYYLNYLKELHLNDNRIERLPREMCRLPNLQYLNVSGNQLIGLPEDISNLRRLQTLIVDRNKLQYLPFSLQTMVNLRTVSANENDLLWLPQRLGTNFYSMSFSFWKNERLNHIPYKVWLHVLKSCRNIPDAGVSYVKIGADTDYDVVNVITCDIPWNFVVPFKFTQIEQIPNVSPPTLRELCSKTFYDVYTNLSDCIFESMEIPAVLREIVSIGPTGICDQFKCKRPLFEYVVLVAAIKYINQNVGGNEVTVTAYFCSKECSMRWLNELKIEPMKWKRMT